jgi:hypothetical protein
MRTKILLILLFAFLFQFGSVRYLHAQIHTYTEKSVLSKGKWAKIKIPETGIYKLTYDEIRNMGFSNPENIRVFGFGGAMLDENILNPRIDDLPEIAIYDGGNYVLFYAQGAIKWNSNLNSSYCRFNFTINPYSNSGYYFLTTDAGVGKRINKEAMEVAGTGDSLWEVTSFIDYACVKKEEKNFARSGRVWYGDVMANGENKRYNFSFPNIETEKEMRIQVSAVASSAKETGILLNVDHLQEKMRIPSSSGHEMAVANEMNLRKYPTSDNIALSLSYSGISTSDRAAVNFITINAWRKLIMSGNAMFFRNDESIGSNIYSRFTLQKAPANTLIWNITDPQNIKEVYTASSSGNLQFTKKTDQLLEFVAVNPSGQFPTPGFVGEISNQNLHAFPSNTDFIIISHPEFLSEANRLAEKHREFDRMNVEVVTPEQVYNEFSSGTPDATAYRWLMKMIYDRDITRNPKYLLLFGDGSYDNKGILTTSLRPGQNFLLTFQSYNSLHEEKSYCTDDYFGFVDDVSGSTVNFGIARVDIGIGRFPVSNLNEAKAVVDKAIAYMENKNAGAWKNRICLIADDNEKYDSPSTFNRFMNNSEEVSRIIYKRNPSMEVKKLYADAFTKVTGSNGNRFTEMETLLSEEIKSGIKFLNYIGHSGITGWSEERFFTQAQARTLQNKNWGLWFTASCEFTRFDDISISSGGEDLFLNPNGGAIAVYSSSRVVFDNLNQRLNRTVAEVLFERDEEGKPLRFGDIHKKSKQTVSDDDSNKLTFVMLADPALRFTYPDLSVKTDSVTFLSDEKTDTIGALSEVRIYGKIEDFFGSEISNFSGKMKIKIYDKESSLFTKTYKFEYKDRPNVLFSGETTVENGVFSFIFKVPKDINYNYGFGRISYYAYDDRNGFEAQGVYEDLVIGGGSDNTGYETQGPEITLFINTEKFHSGDRVNESPVLFAFVKDESGINTSGAGIGHDITLTLNDSNTPVILNSFFNFFPDSYTEGSLVYQLENLEPGKYTLTFKVWDLLNNSTTRQIEFEVERELPMKIEELVAYPNPAQEYVYFRIQHDRPESVLECKVKVYTFDGRLVYESESKNLESSNFLTLGWDLRTSSGNRLPLGVYTYRIEMRTSEGKFTGKSQKLIISGQ